MFIKPLVALALSAMTLFGGATVAAPVQYSFTTSQPVAVFSPGGVVFTPSAFTLFGGASGTFDYDSQATFIGVINGAAVYGDFTPGRFPPTISNLSGVAGSGYTFSDPNGAANIWNDNFSGFGSAPNVDALILAADPIGGSPTTPRNITGFDLGGEYRLIDVRMLWIESLPATISFDPLVPPPPTPDFLTDTSLPGAPPAFAGRLWLDFQKIDNPSVTAFAFYNDLTITPVTAAVPEPETYAMLLVGLCLLGFAARRSLDKRIYA